MTLNQKLASVAAVATVGGAVFLGSSVMAASNNPTTNSSLAQKIAQTFHLNANDVQNVINQEHQDRAQAREQKIKAHLDSLVKNGTITQDQEDKIIAELNTLKQQPKSSNDTNRQDNRQDFRTQIQQWLKDNGINVSLDQLLPPHPMHGMGGMMQDDEQSQT